MEKHKRYNICTTGFLEKEKKSTEQKITVGILEMKNRLVIVREQGGGGKQNGIDVTTKEQHEVLPLQGENNFVSWSQ